MTVPPRIVIAAGGTAGHVVPAIAVADALRAEGAQVTFVGGQRAEAELVPQAGYELDPISVEGISRTNPLKAARAVGKAGGALVAARKILERRNADAVLGLAPLTGVPLPFISYGATNLTVLLAGMGLLLNVAAGGSAHLRVVEGSRRHGSDDRDRRGRDSGARGAGAGRRRRAAG